MSNPFLLVLKLQLDALHQWLSLTRGVIDLCLGGTPQVSSSRSLVPVPRPTARRKR